MFKVTLVDKETKKSLELESKNKFYLNETHKLLKKLIEKGASND